ncbi:hypothetical protein ECC02_010092 [Trypanosoma cruzi]|uniref:Mucin-associated surface protein (MASP) n=1 Tax=Trypanosoma cruzi TaxID=5693 RepID=A0A7J6XRI3_TRYCR|nr:hypothetical protein ECC02_010092 [Trypanosoma cruzi]
MAMMMTGRVLLVCALCVLCCGAGGRCDEGEAAVHGVPPDVPASGTEDGLGGKRNAAPAPDSQIQSSGEEQQHKSREGRPALPEGSSEEEEEEETVENKNLDEVTESREERRHEDGQNANERDGSQTSGVLTKQKETPPPSTPAAPAGEGNQHASPQAPSVDSHGGGGTDRIEGFILKASSSGVALQHAGDAPTNQKNKSLETGRHSENTITGGPVPSQVKAPKESINGAENHSVTGEDTASNQVVGRGTTEYEAQQRALATQDRSSVSFPDSETKWQTTPQETPKTQVPPTATEPSSREEGNHQQQQQTHRHQTLKSIKSYCYQKKKKNRVQCTGRCFRGYCGRATRSIHREFDGECTCHQSSRNNSITQLYKWRW